MVLGTTLTVNLLFADVVQVMNPIYITFTSCNLFSEQRTRLYDHVRLLIPNFSTLSNDEKQIIFSSAINYLKKKSIRISCLRLSISLMQLNGLINSKPSMKPNPCSPTSFSFAFPLLGQDHSLSNYSLALFICFFLFIWSVVFIFFVFFFVYFNLC